MHRASRKTRTTLQGAVLVAFRLAACLPLILVACGSGDLPLEQVDPNAAPQDPTYDQVFGIFYRECVPCHSGEGEGEDEGDDSVSSRYLSSAGVEPPLENCQQILDELGDVIEEIFAKNTMPPGAWPRLTEREKLIIKRWIDNGTPCQ